MKCHIRCRLIVSDIVKEKEIGTFKGHTESYIDVG